MASGSFMAMISALELSRLPEPTSHAFDPERVLVSIGRGASQPERFRALVQGAGSEALSLLEALHRRWVRMFRGLDEAAWHRTFHHPGSGKDYALFQQVEIYAWHGDRHLAQAALALGKDVPT